MEGRVKIVKEKQGREGSRERDARTRTRGGERSCGGGGGGTLRRDTLRCERDM